MSGLNAITMQLGRQGPQVRVAAAQCDFGILAERSELAGFVVPLRVAPVQASGPADVQAVPSYFAFCSSNVGPANQSPGLPGRA